VEELLRTVEGQGGKGSWLVSWVGASGERAGQTVMGYTGWRDVSVASEQRAAAITAVKPSVAGLAVVVNTEMDAGGGRKAVKRVVGRGGANFVVGVSGVPSSRQVYGGHLVHMHKPKGGATGDHAPRSFTTYLTIDVCGGGIGSSGRNSSQCGCSTPIADGDNWASIAETEGWIVSWIDVTADYTDHAGTGSAPGAYSERGWVSGSKKGWDARGDTGAGWNERGLSFMADGAEGPNAGEWKNYVRKELGTNDSGGSGHVLQLSVDVGITTHVGSAAFVASLQGVGLPTFGPCVVGPGSVVLTPSSGGALGAKNTFSMYLGSQAMSVKEAPEAAAAAAMEATVAVAAADRAWPCSELFHSKGVIHTQKAEDEWKVVYIAIHTQDCVLSKWKMDGAPTVEQPYVCSRSCGEGHVRWRRQVVQQARGGGGRCENATVLVKQEACNQGPCPIDCTLSGWGIWG
jgi:hypothetical protein